MAGSSVAAAVVGRRLHVFTSNPDGKGTSHLRLEGTSLECVGELPLRSVTGATGDGEALLACGAHAGDDAPVVCRLEGADVRVIALTPASPVAAWPQLVQGPYVVWATGELLAASVWLSEVQAMQPAKVLDGVGTFAFHVVDGVDVLCYGETLDFARWQPGKAVVKRRLQTPNDAAATLLGGAVVWPTSSHAFDVWLVDPDEHRALELPGPPERASAPARHLRVADDVLYWETHLPDDFRQRLDDDSFRTAHGFSVRAWVARLDRQAWRVTDVVEVPASPSPPLVAWVEGQLALIRAGSGVLEVTLGKPA